MNYIDIKEYNQLPLCHTSDSVSAVFGNDDRIPVSDDTILPYSAVIRLLIIENGIRYRGTGFMIGPNIMLTAAHNVYNHKKSKNFDEIKLLDRNGTVCHEVCKVYVNNNYKTKDSDTYDWAVTEVTVTPGSTAPYINILRTDLDTFADIIGSEAEIPGFPVSVKGKDTSVMHTEKGVIIDHCKQEKTLHYRIDTSGGNSGSPVIVYKDGTAYAIGIHVSSYDNYNSARAIDKKIEEVVAAMKA